MWLIEPYTLQIAQFPRRTVIQAIEAEAEQLLLQRGGKVERCREGYLYEDYLDVGFPTLIIFWPVQTRFVYVAARGQEDSDVIFMAALLPESQTELHLTYDYRPWNPLYGPFEEFFTLRVARERLFV
ncbi:MAG: hypothetical protein IMW89_21275 [Ktedonobacteraceae bacterium]|jgi:hypothetical protein|nr:hypothetical protein [Ktedonobacteraceae bacterium]